MWPGYFNEHIWWEFFLELTFVKSIQVCVYFISSIWLPTQWCHVQQSAKKSVNAPSKSYTLNWDLMCGFCACVCMARQPVLLEHRALHGGTAVLSCGWWSAGRHSGHGRLLCHKHLLLSPLRCWKGSELSQLICFRGVLERDCQLEASRCCKSFMQFHRRGFLYPWGLQVLCRHSKLFCAWALFPAHFLAESWFSKGCSNVWVVDLTLCLCLWSGWWGGSLCRPLYALLPLMPDLVVCLLPSVTESFPWVAQFLISFMQNRMCHSGMK